MENNELLALVLALVTFAAVVAGLSYANRDNIKRWRQHRRNEQRRRERLKRERSHWNREVGPIV